ncbi:MAG: hypothetical protein LC676_06945 [Loktanella sp.]|nr:hypothetical protein [Loktanella sp.]
MMIDITNQSNVTTLTKPQSGIFTHETMTREEFNAYITGIVGRKTVRPSVQMAAPYYLVEYLNAPAGLIVLAHHDTDAAQVDGIHPAIIGDDVAANFCNIVEPLKGIGPKAPAYNVHWMTRRAQGSLLMKAFGRNIDVGDDEAPYVKPEKCKNFHGLVIFNTKIGPIVGVIESNDRICVIRPRTV